MAATNLASELPIPAEDTTAELVYTSITYLAPEALNIPAEDATVKVIYSNEEGLTHERSINVPRLEDGSVNEEYYQEILESQLRGVENKVAINVITFADPKAENS